MRMLPIAIWLVLPNVSWACAVCFSATESNRGAFIGTTAFLTLLPLFMLGSAAWWLYRRVQQMDRLERDA